MGVRGRGKPPKLGAMVSSPAPAAHDRKDSLDHFRSRIHRSDLRFSGAAERGGTGSMHCREGTSSHGTDTSHGARARGGGVKTRGDAAATRVIVWR